MADKVSAAFLSKLEKLAPCGPPNGNLFLYLVDKFDIQDKHKLLIPVGDYTTIASHQIIKQVPDFPRDLTDFGFGQNRRDVVWKIFGMNRAQRRSHMEGVSTQRLNVPVHTVISIDSIYRGEIRATLNSLFEATSCSGQVKMDTELSSFSQVLECIGTDIA